MAVLPESSTCLELTISVPGFASSSTPSLPSSGENKGGEKNMNGRRDLDINQVPSDEEWTEIMEADQEEGEEESPNNSINGDGEDGTEPPPKKLRLTKEQSRLLEETFRQNRTLNPKQKEAFAMELRVKPRQVEVWFQNRRARSKIKQTEIECEYLKRWFGSLSAQNKKLQKEVEELRAMKVGTPTSCHLLPPSTLTMCPQCERVTTAATTTSSTNPTTLSSKAPLSFLRSRHPSSAC